MTFGNSFTKELTVRFIHFMNPINKIVRNKNNQCKNLEIDISRLINFPFAVTILLLSEMYEKLQMSLIIHRSYGKHQAGATTDHKRSTRRQLGHRLL